MGVVMLIPTMATVFAIHEPKAIKGQAQAIFISTFTGVLEDRVFLSALLPCTFFITGTSMVQGALVYYFTYIFGDEGLFQLALIALLSFSLLGEYHGPLYGVIIMGATGIGLSTHYVMPHAILPDVVEYGSIKQTAEEGRGCSPVFGLSPAR